MAMIPISATLFFTESTRMSKDEHSIIFELSPKRNFATSS